MPLFMEQPLIILVLIGTAILIIWEVFNEIKILNSVHLLQSFNFVSRSRLELMHVSFIVNIRSNFIHPHGF